MATTSKLKREGRTMRLNGIKSTYTATFRVITDTLVTSPIIALVESTSASPNAVPLYGATYNLGTGVTDDFDLGSFAQDYDVKDAGGTDTTNLWDITVTWRPFDSSPHSPTDRGTTPVDRAVRYTMEFIETQEIVSNAWNVAAINTRAANTLGPIINSAGEQFHDAVIEDDKVLVLVAKKNFLTLEHVAAYHRYFNRTLNSDTIYGYTAHKAKFLSVELGEVINEQYGGASVPYYPATIKIAFKDTEWYLPVVNKGMKVRPSAGAEAVGARDKNNHPVSSPILLAANGTALPDGTIGNTISYRTRRAVAYDGSWNTGTSTGGLGI